MSACWKFFNKSLSIASCKANGCDWKKDLAPSMSTNFLTSHLKAAHPESYEEIEKLKTEKAQKKEAKIQQTLAQRECLKRSMNPSFSAGQNEIDDLFAGSPEKKSKSQSTLDFVKSSKYFL